MDKAMKQQQSLTVIMYHYVRDLPHTRYPKFKALLTSRFITQLDYIQGHYSIITLDQCIAAYSTGLHLPDNPALLTFDDGFSDHYLTVMPLLAERSMTGVFFVPAQPIWERRLLDVHKIHYILATTEDYRALVDRVFALVGHYREDFPIPPNDELRERAAIGSRFDPPQITLVKTLLQRGLPSEVRSNIVDELFRETVKVDEVILANEHYMTMPQLKVMVNNGMYIGGHGFAHRWIGHLAAEYQGGEIRQTIDLLTQVYGDHLPNWAMAYPYGDWSELQLDLLKASHCSIAFTGDPKVAKVDSANRFRIPRLDTNDVPCG